MGKKRQRDASDDEEPPEAKAARESKKTRVASYSELSLDSLMEREIELANEVRQRQQELSDARRVKPLLYGNNEARQMKTRRIRAEYAHTEVQREIQRRFKSMEESGRTPSSGSSAQQRARMGESAGDTQGTPTTPAAAPAAPVARHPLAMPVQAAAANPQPVAVPAHMASFQAVAAPLPMHPQVGPMVIQGMAAPAPPPPPQAAFMPGAIPGAAFGFASIPGTMSSALPSGLANAIPGGLPGAIPRGMPHAIPSAMPSAVSLDVASARGALPSLWAQPSAMGAMGAVGAVGGMGGAAMMAPPSFAMAPDIPAAFRRLAQPAAPVAGCAGALGLGAPLAGPAGVPLAFLHR